MGPLQRFASKTRGAGRNELLMIPWYQTRGGIKARLAAMLFLQYFIWGAWYVTIGTWLGRTLRFSGTEIALGCGNDGSGRASIAVSGRFAGRPGICGGKAAGGASLGHMFAPVYVLLLLYACCYMPILALTNTLAFRQMRDPGVEFAPLRVLGTTGWIAAGLLVGGLALEATRSSGQGLDDDLAGCPGAVSRTRLCGIHGGIAADLRPAAVLLRIHQSVSQ